MQPKPVPPKDTVSAAVSLALMSESWQVFDGGFRVLGQWITEKEKQSRQKSCGDKLSNPLLSPLCDAAFMSHTADTKNATWQEHR